MRISRSRHIKANMGNFESFEFGATVTLDHNDLGYTDDDVREMDIEDLRAEIAAKVAEYLTGELRQDVVDAVNLTGEDKSFILHGFQLDRGSASKPRKSRRG